MNILITDPLGEEGLDLLRRAGFNLLYFPQHQDYREHLPAVDGWIVRSGTKITATELNQAKRLKVIGRAGVGLDNIDCESAEQFGIKVMNTPDANTVAVAEHVMGLMLTLLRRIIPGHQMVTEGRWDRHSLVGEECSGKILGIIGLGKIGRAVAERARAFGMTIMGYDPYLSREQFAALDVQALDLNHLRSEADIITIHIPRTPETENLINADFLSAMKSSAYLINCARGGIVDERALMEALNTGSIAGAALDVYASEPPEHFKRLSQCPNLVLTPHLGASTREAKNRVSLEICTRLSRYLNSRSSLPYTPQ